MRRPRVLFIDMEYGFSGVSTGMRVRWTRQGPPSNGSSIYVLYSLSESKLRGPDTFPLHREDGPAFYYADWRVSRIRTMHVNYINGAKKFTAGFRVC